MIIRGRVVAAGGAPLAKAEVSLREARQTFRARQYAAVTGADGAFSLDVEPGPYFVVADRSGYVTTSFGGRAPMTGFVPLTVAPDRRLDEIVLTMTPHAVITGRVLNEDDEPFEGVRVMLLQELPVGSGMRYAPAQAQQGVTNDEGEFRVFGVGPGKYLLQAVADSHRRRGMGIPYSAAGGTAYPEIYYPDVTDPDEAQLIGVAMGARLGGFELRMRPMPAFSVRGRVEWPGRASRNATVAIHPKRSGIMIGGGFPFFGGDTFEFGGLLPGPYMITATYESNQSSRQTHLDLEVVDRDIDDVVVRFPEGATVEGSVRGLPSSVELAITLIGQGMMHPQTRLREDGSFRLEDVVPGSYRVQMWELPRGAYVKPDSVEVEGRARLDLEVRFDSATLTGAAEPPTPGILVRVWQGRSVVSQAQTDQDGRYSLEGIPPGEYTITASEPKWGCELPAGGDRVTLAPSERLSLNVMVQ